jgi:hypothetical protein
LKPARGAGADSELDELSKADLAAHSVEEQLAAPGNASLSAQLAPFTEALRSCSLVTKPRTRRSRPAWTM